MKKILLSLAALTAAAGINASDFVIGSAITKEVLEKSPGEHKVILKVYTKATPGFVHPVTSGETTFFGGKDTGKTEDAKFTEDYVYTINVDEQGHFTLMNANGMYAPVPNNGNQFAGTASASEAVKFHARTGITSSAAHSDYYMLEADNATGSFAGSNIQIHLNNNCYYVNTAPAGLGDAGGMGTGNDTRTAGAFMMYKAIELANPLESETYFRMLNREGDNGGTRAHSYLGYYPESGSTEWYIYNKDDNSNGGRPNLIKSNLITCGNFASERTGANDAQIDGQLWKLVAGSGDNAGKYCLVNKSYPEGAISKKIVDNNGVEQTSGGTNASRWIYVENRTNTPDEVCWFNVDTKEADGATYYRFTFDNPLASSNIYFTLAAGGMKYQMMRWNLSDDDANKGSWWVFNDPDFDPEETINAGTETLKTAALGFAAMKGAINNAELGNFYAWASRDNVADRITAANTHYQNYINRFNNKFVTIYNNRRSQANLGSKPWLAVYVNDSGNVVINSLTDAQKNDDCIWLTKVENNKLRFYNRTTGYQLHAQLLIPSQGSGGVRLKLNSEEKYIHLSGSSGDLMTWGDENDLGSVWTIAAADYTFCEPEFSTADAPKYYRIISDRMVARNQNPNFGIDGESRSEASGTGEEVNFKNLSSPGIYWRLEQQEDGTVKVFNLVDGYAMAGGRLTMGEADNAAKFYLTRLNDTFINGRDGAKFSIANTYAFNSTNSATSNALNLNGANTPIVSSWAPTGDNLDCMQVAGASGNGALFYFIPASDNDVARATEKYIAAVQNTLPRKDSETISGFVDNAKVAEYEAFFSTGEATTISEVNAAKRSSNIAGIRDFMSTLLDEQIVGQHIQLSATKPGWSVNYMKDNGSKIIGTTDETDFATLWTIAKGTNGYTFTNEATGNVITLGNNSQSTDFPTAESDAFEFAMTYNHLYAKFAIHQPGMDVTDTRSSIHLANHSNGNTVKWSSAGIENSHWLISALAEPEISVEFDGDRAYNVSFTGEFTDKAKEEGTTVATIWMLEETEEVEPAMLRAAAENGTLTATFTASQFEANKAPIDGQLAPGKYALEIPGAMLTTAEGKHTRALYSLFTVNNDGTITGIEEITSKAQPATGIIYDLQGRRVTNPRHGIYIIDGRKVRL